MHRGAEGVPAPGNPINSRSPAPPPSLLAAPACPLPLAHLPRLLSILLPPLLVPVQDAQTEKPEDTYQATFDTLAGGDWATAFIPWHEFVLVKRARSVPGAPPIDPSRIRQFGLVLSRCGVWGWGPWEAGTGVGAGRPELGWRAGLGLGLGLVEAGRGNWCRWDRFGWLASWWHPPSTQNLRPQS